MASNIELALPILFLCLLALIHEKIVENQNYVIENFHSSWWPSVFTLPTAEILNGKNAWAFLVCGFLMKSFKKKYAKKKKKNRGSHLEVTCWIGCATSNFFEYKIIETHACTFLPINISAAGNVGGGCSPTYILVIS